MKRLTLFSASCLLAGLVGCLDQAGDASSDPTPDTIERGLCSLRPDVLRLDLAAAVR